MGKERSWCFHVNGAEMGNLGYPQALRCADDLIRSCQPDLIIYQAGVDCHRNDPKSTVKLTTRQLFERDLFVFRMARSREIPILFVAAGGYQSAASGARLHVNTVRAAVATYFK
jgi:acetoin utilization deacetylase AcuC-like enzyme